MREPYLLFRWKDRKSRICKSTVAGIRVPQISPQVAMEELVYAESQERQGKPQIVRTQSLTKL